MNEKEKRKGFTLIELLVVMAIIMLLAGASMPVYHRFRASGYAVKCLGNLNAIGKALNAYQAEYKGWMPYILDEKGEQSRTAEYRHANKAVIWKYEISAIINNIDPDTYHRKRFRLCDAFFDPVSGRGKGNYFVSKKQFGAKVQVYTWDPATKTKKWIDYYDYANLSSYRVGGVQGKVVKQVKPKGYMPYTTWKEPAKAAIVAPSKDPKLQRGLGRESEDNMDEENVNIEYRHLGSANVLFLDGHVKQYSKGDESLFEHFDKKDMEKAEMIRQLDNP